MITKTDVAQSAPASTSQPAFFAGLSYGQYVHLIDLLHFHLPSAKIENIMASSDNSHVARICPSAFSCFSTDLTQNFWIIDSGASSHICFSKNLFHNMRPVFNTSVVLPTLTRAPVKFVGDVFI